MENLKELFQKLKEYDEEVEILEGLLRKNIIKLLQEKLNDWKNNTIGLKRYKLGIYKHNNIEYYLTFGSNIITYYDDDMGTGGEVDLFTLNINSLIGLYKAVINDLERVATALINSQIQKKQQQIEELKQLDKQVNTILGLDNII